MTIRTVGLMVSRMETFSSLWWQVGGWSGQSVDSLPVCWSCCSRESLLGRLASPGTLQHPEQDNRRLERGVVTVNGQWEQETSN